MFINILNQYICKCAEFTLNPFVLNSDSKWQSFVSNVNQIFQYYELTNTEEYRISNLQYRITNTRDYWMIVQQSEYFVYSLI